MFGNKTVVKSYLTNERSNVLPFVPALIAIYLRIYFYCSYICSYIQFSRVNRNITVIACTIAVHMDKPKCLHLGKPHLVICTYFNNLKACCTYQQK